MMDDTLPARVAIVGAGAMGSGIALSFARGGSRCTLIEPALSRAEQALDGLREIVADHVADGLLPEDEAAAMTDRIGIAELAGEGGALTAPLSSSRPSPRIPTSRRTSTA